jgi:tRNA(Ile)-lysidine synthase
MHAPTVTRFLHQVRQTISRYGMILPGERVLVAVSGGPDSVALLGALEMVARRCRIQLCAAHFNHRLRGAESERDQAGAVAVAARLGVPCMTGTSAALADANLEARAREQRYAFLTEVAAAQRCTKIATGHTLDDQAETVLMRLLRGTGWDGLAGIHAVRDGRIIRPLIECSRQQVLAFLQERGLPFCEDSSNDDRRFLRNRVRHEVLPLLRAINPEVQRHLAATAHILAAEGGVLDDILRMAVLRTADGVKEALTISAIYAAPQGLAPRLVRAWLRRQRGSLTGLGAAHVQAIVDLARGARPNAQVRLPGGQMVVREYEHLRWRAKATAMVPPATHVLMPGATLELETGWRISAELVAASPARTADLWSLAADADAIAAPLIVRRARRGDRIRPLGMQGHRKLQDVFVDRKLPRALRQTCPVVEVDGEVLWVPGVVRSGRALITPATRSALRLVAENPAIAGAKPLC